MLKNKRQIEEEAIGWVIRLRDGDDSVWVAFTEWLEADPAHAEAYEEAALADSEAGEMLPPRAEPQFPHPARPISPTEALPQRRHGRRGLLGWAAAASLLLITGYATLGGSSGRYVVETAAGERREIVLKDGSRIQLNGGTKVSLDEENPRFARLEEGEALFHVVHDSAAPFEVEAGEAVLRDMGTVFNVVHDTRGLEVAVSEGAVLYNPDKEAANLTPGMGLRRSVGGRVWVGKVDPGAIGAWREGRLVYSAAPVSRIAADLSRGLGVPVNASADVAARPFSGVIMLEGGRDVVLERASALLGLSLRRAGDGWILTARRGAHS